METAMQFTKTTVRICLHEQTFRILHTDTGSFTVVSVSAILFLSYKIRADVLSSALIPLIR